MPSLEQIQESIEARIGELRSEMTSLQAARAVLDTNGAPRARSGRAVASGTATKSKRRRSSRSASQESAAGANGEAAPAAVSGSAPASSEPSTKATATSPGQRSRTQSRPAKPKRLVEVLLAGKLEAMLRDAEDGLNAVAIAKQANARPTQVRDLLRELEVAGQVRRTGAGRASRWRVVTDEERIAKRAAELEARSTSRR
jgi:hypothetical protein